MITSWGTKRCATGTSLLLLLITAQSQALDFTGTTNNGTITITCYDGKGKVLIVPSSINGLPVTSIGEGVFSNCIAIKIPNTITNIGRAQKRGRLKRLLYPCTETGSVKEVVISEG
jgi:hypothetical protein